MTTLTAKDFEGKNLAQKLATIMGAVSYVQKKGYNSHHKYKFVREADLVDAVRPLLAMAGVIMLPRVSFQERVGELTRIVYEYDITDGVDTLHTSALGEGADKQDKAGYKAMTGAQKYALYKLFQIATGDDPEEAEEVTPHPTRIPVAYGTEFLRLSEALDKTSGSGPLDVVAKEIGNSKTKGLLTEHEVLALRQKFSSKAANQ